jgi:hypothetical protein
VNSLLERPPAVTPPRRRVRLIENGRDLAAYLREAFSELPAPAMWDEITNASELIRKATNERNHIVAEMLAYVEDLCEEDRCDWCGFCQCAPDCRRVDEECLRG